MPAEPWIKSMRRSLQIHSIPESKHCSGFWSFGTLLQMSFVVKKVLFGGPSHSQIEGHDTQQSNNPVHLISVQAHMHCRCQMCVSSAHLSEFPKRPFGGDKELWLDPQKVQSMVLQMVAGHSLVEDCKSFMMELFLMST